MLLESSRALWSGRRSVRTFGFFLLFFLVAGPIASGETNGFLSGLMVGMDKKSVFSKIPRLSPFLSQAYPKSASDLVPGQPYVYSLMLGELKIKGVFIFNENDAVAHSYGAMSENIDKNMVSSLLKAAVHRLGEPSDFQVIKCLEYKEPRSAVGAIWKEGAIKYGISWIIGVDGPGRLEVKAFDAGAFPDLPLFQQEAALSTEEANAILSKGKDEFKSLLRQEGS